MRYVRIFIFMRNCKKWNFYVKEVIFQQFFFFFVLTNFFLVFLLLYFVAAHQFKVCERCKCRKIQKKMRKEHANVKYIKMHIWTRKYLVEAPSQHCCIYILFCIFIQFTTQIIHCVYYRTCWWLNCCGKSY